MNTSLTESNYNNHKQFRNGARACCRALLFAGLAAALPARISQRVEAAPAACSVTRYDLGVELFPLEHRLKVRAAMTLTAEAAREEALRFRLLRAFKTIALSQGGKPLTATLRDKDQAVVEGVQVGPAAPPLVWEYEGGVHTQPEGDYTSEVIMYDDEVRPAVHCAWYPHLQGASSARLPASTLTIEVPANFSVVSGDQMTRPPEIKGERRVFRFSSVGQGSLSFVAAPMERMSLQRAGVEVEAFYWPSAPAKPSPGPQLQRERHRPQDPARMQALLEESGKILEYFSSLFSPYAARKFSIVQKGNYKGHAYGVKTFLVLNELDLDRISAKTLAHEVAHNWWGAQTYPVGPGSCWLSESMAEYGAFLYLEHTQGSRKVVGDSREFLLRSARGCTPLLKTASRSSDYETLAYHIGPLLHHTLRYVMGDRDFFTLLKRFASEYENRAASVADYQAMAEQIRGEKLDWFFDGWLGHTTAPVLVLDATSTPQGDGKAVVQGRILQELGDFRLPVRLECSRQDRKETRTVWVQGSETALALPLDFQPERVVFAPEMPFWVLAAFYDSPAERQAAATQMATNAPAAKQSIQELLAELVAKHHKFQVLEKAFPPGTDLELVLRENQSVRLLPGDNPYELKEILVGVLSGQEVRLPQAIEDERFVFSNGHISGGGKALESGHNGSQGRRMGSAPYRLRTTWSVEGEQVKLHLRLEPLALPGTDG